MELLKKEYNIIQSFSILNGWEEKYEYLITLGKELPQFSDKYKTVNNLIRGCQSQVWLYAYIKNNFLILNADSDALIPKGIAALMIKIYSEVSPIEVIKSNPLFISKIGFQEFLSPIRANGILLMYKQIKLYAIAFTKKHLMSN